MKKKLVKISPFMVDPEPIEESFSFQAGDFESASLEERESVVEKHKSVSYWRDAARRFRKNTVSMVALFMFLLLLIFAFIGPSYVPYDYEQQYRKSKAQNLEPMTFSEVEEQINALGKRTDGFFATELQPGSYTVIKKGDYYVKSGGKTYAFRLEKNKEKAVLILDKDAETPIMIVDMKQVNEDGSWNASTPVTMMDEPSDDAKEIKLSKSVFPHVFGTDDQGRDLMARTMYGAQVSIIIGITAALIVLVIGSVYGAISGLYGGKVDFVMMRIVELIYSIPDILIVLLLQVVLKDPLQEWFDAHKTGIGGVLGDLGVGIVSIFITFALLYWVTMARIVRGQVLQLKKQEFVTAAVALGAGKWRIIRRHLLPNSVGALVITTCLQIPSAIFLESFLSFLGLGVSAPMASLGSLCSDAKDVITLFPHRLIFPAIVLTLIVLTLNLVGDGLRDALDPRLKK